MDKDNLIIWLFSPFDICPGYGGKGGEEEQTVEEGSLNFLSSYLLSWSAIVSFKDKDKTKEVWTKSYLLSWSAIVSYKDKDKDKDKTKEAGTCSAA